MSTFALFVDERVECKWVSEVVDRVRPAQMPQIQLPRKAPKGHQLPSPFSQNGSSSI